MEPKLSEAELAAVDFLIADAKASGSGVVEMAAVTAVVREVARQAGREVVRQAVREVVRAVAGGRVNAGLTSLSEDDLRSIMREELSSSGVSLDDLIKVRQQLAKE